MITLYDKFEKIRKNLHISIDRSYFWKYYVCNNRLHDGYIITRIPVRVKTCDVQIYTATNYKNGDATNL